ncbi:MAG: energy-coupling factor transporter transmembrane component T [Chloroflexota bacterium]|nr:energy-coupling factor transporter transmembrane component T [Chloroflexota bacterium]
MSNRFDLYVARSSWLHRLDPRTKLAFVGVSFALLFLSSRLSLLAGYLVVVHLLLRAARIPSDRIRWLWRQMWPLTLLILLLWPIFYPTGQPTLLTLWRVRITLPSLLQGLANALRVNGLAFAVFVLLVSTDQARLVQGLVQLGIPFELGLTLAIALRYLPLLYSVYGTITDAQRARGWRAEQGSLPERLRAHVPTLVALIIAALRLSDTLTLALAARGFRPGHPRTTHRPRRLRRADLLCLAGLSLLLAIMVGLRLGFCAFSCPKMGKLIK